MANIIKTDMAAHFGRIKKCCYLRGRDGNSRVRFRRCWRVRNWWV